MGILQLGVQVGSAVRAQLCWLWVFSLEPIALCTAGILWVTLTPRGSLPALLSAAVLVLPSSGCSCPARVAWCHQRLAGILFQMEESQCGLQLTHGVVGLFGTLWITLGPPGALWCSDSPGGSREEPLVCSLSPVSSPGDLALQGLLLPWQPHFFKGLF